MTNSTGFCRYTSKARANHRDSQVGVGPSSLLDSGLVDSTYQPPAVFRQAALESSNNMNFATPLTRCVFRENFGLGKLARLIGELVIRWLAVEEDLFLELEFRAVLEKSSRDSVFIRLRKPVI